MRGNGMRGVRDKAEVGFVILVQGRGDANNNCVHRSYLRIVGSCREAVRLSPLDFFRCNPVDVGSTFGQSLHLTPINVEAGYAKLLLAIKKSERKTNVTEPDDANLRLALLNFLLDLFQGRICGWVGFYLGIR